METAHICSKKCTHYPILKNCFVGVAEKELYQIEGEISELISNAAKEISRIFGHKESEFWTHSLPMELYSILDSYDNKASEAAAIKYLAQRGYNTEKI